METFLLSPLKVLRKSFGSILVPSIPILFLVMYILSAEGGVAGPTDLMVKTDYYLGGNMYLAAANLTAYQELSTNIQIPLIRLGGIAERTNISAILGGPGTAEFIMAFTVLFFGFLSYAMVARVVHSLQTDKHEMFGFAAINGASIVLSVLGAFLMLFFASFYLGGLKLLVVVGFGIYFTFSIPFAAIGQPLGESMYKGFKFVSSGMSRIVASYLACMGASVMIPIGLLLFTTPLIVNLPASQTGLATLLRVFLGLFSVVAALFYQMSICATAIFGLEEPKEKAPAVEEAQASDSQE